MATIDSKEIVKAILMNDGVYPGDPRCTSVWQYRTPEGNLTQAVYGRFETLLPSEWIQDPIQLWDADEGLLEAGELWLEKQGITL